MADDNANAVSNTARAISQIPFVAFSTNLLREVMRTLVDSNIEQMEAYADLVSNVGGSLVQYENKMLGNTLSQKLLMVDNYIKDELNKSKPTTNQSSDIRFSDTDTIDFLLADFEKVKPLFETIVITQKILRDGDPNTTGEQPPAFLSLTPEKKFSDYTLTGTSGTYSIPAPELRMFVYMILQSQVKTSYDKLVQILQTGLQRTVVDRWSVNTKLLFHTNATETDTSDASITHQDYSTKTTSWAVNASANYSSSLRNGILNPGKKFASGLIGRSFGGAISGGVQSAKNVGSLDVTVVNKSTFNNLNTTIDIMGEMKVEGHTDFFPSFTPKKV